MSTPNKLITHGRQWYCPACWGRAKIVQNNSEIDDSCTWCGGALSYALDKYFNRPPKKKASPSTRLRTLGNKL